MTFPTTFSQLAAGTQPASLLDTMYSICGQMGIIPCTATGTNVITLTPNTNFFLPTVYTAFQAVGFVAVATSTGSVTIQITTLTPVPLFMATGVQAGGGDIVNGTFYIAFFVPSLNSGNGGFIVQNSTVAAAPQPVRNTISNFTATNAAGGASTTTLIINADEVLVENVAGGIVRLSSQSQTINASTNGANGLDTGALAASTPYSVWFIFNPVTNAGAGLMSLSTTSPTLPSGYTYKARCCWIMTDSASKLKTMRFRGAHAQYQVDGTANNTTLPVLVNADGTTALTQRSFATLVPPTATRVHIRMTGSVTVAGNTAATTFAIFPNGNYASVGDAPILSANTSTSGAAALSAGSFPMSGSLGVEAAASLWTQISLGAGATATLSVVILGYEDNVP